MAGMGISSSTTSITTNTTSTLDGLFCSTPGQVMNNGYSLSKGGACILFLFQNAVVDTGGKYAAALFASLAMGVVVELLRVFRVFLAQRHFVFTHTMYPLALDIFLTLAFTVQMMFAYWLMLLVMLYEYVVFIFVLLGLAIGHFITLRLQRHYLCPYGSKTTASTGSTKMLYSPPASGSPCCGDGAIAARFVAAPASEPTGVQCTHC